MPVAICQQPDDEMLIAEAAATMARDIGDSVHRFGMCRVALSGGDTSRALYERLATSPFSEAIPWSRTLWFFDDERWVPPDDSRSNAGMAEAALFSNVPLPPHHIFPIPTDAADPRSGARTYELALRAQFPPTPWPAFDVVIMGLGSDGHTASLFPGDAALAEHTAWVTATRAGQPVPDRVTLTAPVFTHARSMLFLAIGAAKAEAVAGTLEGPRDPVRWPAQATQPASGRCVWFIDRDAASHLKNTPQHPAHRS